MSRFIMIAATFGVPPSGPAARYGRGTTIADSAANAVGGDIVWPSLCTSPPPTLALPLDAAGSTAMGGVTIVTLAQLATYPSGVGGGAGMGQC